MGRIRHQLLGQPGPRHLLAVACNKQFDPTSLERSLIDIWSPP
jgi:hypothetical protein